MRTGGGGRLLRGNPRRRQNRDCDNQAKTSGVAIHNLFSRQLSVSEKRRLVISPGHLGKTFRVHTRERGLSGRPLFENDDRAAFGTYRRFKSSVPASVMSFPCRRVESKSTTFSALPCETAINSIT